MRYHVQYDSMGTLYIVSTPIGNLEDITIRAIKTLFSVDIVACEDRRRTGLLLHALKKYVDNHAAAAIRLSIVREKARGSNKDSRGSNKNSNGKDERERMLVRFDDHTESQQTPWLVEQLLQGINVALVSDAGTPLISDPGYKLVSEAIKRGIKVVSIPGPTAAIAALTISGLPMNQFLFLGYPPEKEKHRKDLFHNLITMQPSNHPTIIFYCAPHKLHQTLTDMQTVFGDILIVIARELTKIHEEVWRGTLTEAFKHFSDPQGEFVFLLQLP